MVGRAAAPVRAEINYIQANPSERTIVFPKNRCSIILQDNSFGQQISDLSRQCAAP